MNDSDNSSSDSNPHPFLDDYPKVRYEGTSVPRYLEGTYC